MTFLRRALLAGASAAALALAATAALEATAAHAAGLSITGVDQSRFPLVSVAVNDDWLMAYWARALVMRSDIAAPSESDQWSVASGQ